MKNLLIAIKSKAGADPGSDLYGAIADRFYFYQPPQEAAFPYIVFTVVDELNEKNFDNDPEYGVWRIQMSIYSNDESAVEVLNIYEYLKDVFDDCSMAPTNYTFYGFTRNHTTFYKNPMTGIWQLNVDYILQASVDNAAAGGSVFPYTLPFTL